MGVKILGWAIGLIFLCLALGGAWGLIVAGFEKQALGLLLYIAAAVTFYGHHILEKLEAIRKHQADQRWPADAKIGERFF